MQRRKFCGLWFKKKPTTFEMEIKSIGAEQEGFDKTGVGSARARNPFRGNAHSILGFTHNDMIEGGSKG
jgi:hypothetical protein